MKGAQLFEAEFNYHRAAIKGMLDPAMVKVVLHPKRNGKTWVKWGNKRNRRVAVEINDTLLSASGVLRLPEFAVINLKEGGIFWWMQKYPQGGQEGLLVPKIIRPLKLWDWWGLGVVKDKDYEAKGFPDKPQSESTVSSLDTDEEAAIKKGKEDKEKEPVKVKKAQHKTKKARAEKEKSQHIKDGTEKAKKGAEGEAQKEAEGKARKESQEKARKEAEALSTDTIERAEKEAQAKRAADIKAYAKERAERKAMQKAEEMKETRKKIKNFWIGKDTPTYKSLVRTLAHDDLIYLKVLLWLMQGREKEHDMIRTSQEQRIILDGSSDSITGHYHHHHRPQRILRDLTDRQNYYVNRYPDKFRYDDHKVTPSAALYWQNYQTPDFLKQEQVDWKDSKFVDIVRLDLHTKNVWGTSRVDPTGVDTHDHKIHPMTCINVVCEDNRRSVKKIEASKNFPGLDITEGDRWSALRFYYGTKDCPENCPWRRFDCKYDCAESHVHPLGISEKFPGDETAAFVPIDATNKQKFHQKVGEAFLKFKYELLPGQQAKASTKTAWLYWTPPYHWNPRRAVAGFWSDLPAKVYAGDLADLAVAIQVCEDRLTEVSYPHLTPPPPPNPTP